MTDTSENTENANSAGARNNELIGIVTVLFNSDEVLPAFFESLGCQRGARYRAYIIDNSKSDSGSRLCHELAEFHGITAEIVFNDANVGVARGNNQGIERALRDGCTHVLLSNNDLEFTDPELIINMVTFATNRNVDAVVPKIYYHSDPNRIWCAGGCFSLYSATTPHFGDGEIDQGQYDRSCAIDYAPTCFMLLRAEVFGKVGTMDERYFVYYDDTDFMWRIKAAGKHLYYWPQGRVWHKVSFSTGGGESLFSLFYGFRNRIFFIRKNYPTALRLLSIAYIFATLPIKFLRFDGKQRDAVRRGLREGFAMQI